MVFAVAGERCGVLRWQWERPGRTAGLDGGLDRAGFQASRAGATNECCFGGGWGDDARSMISVRNVRTRAALTVSSPCPLCWSCRVSLPAMPMRVLCLLAVCSPVLGLQGGVALTTRGTSPFMLASGVTAPQELCVVGDDGPCCPRRGQACVASAWLLWQERCCCRTVWRPSLRAVVRSCGLCAATASWSARRAVSVLLWLEIACPWLVATQRRRTVAGGKPWVAASSNWQMPMRA